MPLVREASFRASDFDKFQHDTSAIARWRGRRPAATIFHVTPQVQQWME
jgi:hypothetical protein